MYEQEENQDGATIINVSEVINMKTENKVLIGFAVVFAICYMPVLIKFIWWLLGFPI